MKPMGIWALFGSMIAGALIGFSAGGNDVFGTVLFAAAGPVVYYAVCRVNAKKPPAKPGERV